MKEKKILIISPHQLGDLLDSYYWAKYSVELGYKVTYLGYRYRQCLRNPIDDNSFDKVLVRRDRNYVIFAVCFFFTIIKTILLCNFRNVIVVDFPFCKILPFLFPCRNIIYDIRTASVSKNSIQREKENARILKYSKCFKKISVISNAVAEDLQISKYNLLPLGAIEFSKLSKRFSSLNLLYIGTFNNRNLDILIDGLFLFKEKYNEPFTLDLIGGGDEFIVKQLFDLINKYKLENNIIFHGYLNHQEAKEYFDKCNIGVSYIPITSYYDNQPPTKTFEYLLSGLVCLGTRTKANQQIINNQNGILINDSAEDVCDGLKVISDKLSEYDSEIIKETVKQYNWKEIVRSYFISLFEG